MDRAARGSAAIVIVLALLAAGLSLVITRSGIAVSRDSRWYIETTRWVGAYGVPARIDDNGVHYVQPHYPPGLPYVLAGINKITGLNASEAARWLNAGVFFGSTLLIAGIVWHATGRHRRGAVAAALFVLAVGTWQSHLTLWSEPSFQFCMLASILLASLHLNKSRWSFLFLAALFAGSGVLIRYAGVAFVGAAALGILFAPRPTVLCCRKLAEAVLFGIVATIPSVVWVVWYARYANSAAPRPIVHTVIGWQRARAALRAMGEWLMYEVRSETIVYGLGWIAIAIVLTTIGLAVRAMYRRSRAPKDAPRVDAIATTVPIPLFYCFVYPAFLILTVSFFDPATPFDRRLLYPMHIACIVLVTSLLPATYLWMRGLVGVLLAAQVVAVYAKLHNIREGGLGYNSLSWQRQPAIRIARKLPRDVPILTNNPEAIELATGRNATQLPRVDRLDPNDKMAFKRATNLLKNRVIDGTHVILLNWHRDGRKHLSITRLQKAFTLVEVNKSPTGAVYRIDRPEQRSTTGPTTGPTTVPTTVPAPVQ